MLVKVKQIEKKSKRQQSRYIWRKGVVKAVNVQHKSMLQFKVDDDRLLGHSSYAPPDSILLPRNGVLLLLPPGICRLLLLLLVGEDSI